MDDERRKNKKRNRSTRLSGGERVIRNYGNLRERERVGTDTVVGDVLLL